MNFLASSLFLFLLVGNCHAFTAPLQQAKWSTVSQYPRSISLRAITKRQTYILDGAELSYYIKTLQQQHSLSNDNINCNNSNDIKLPNLAPRSPNKCNRIGCVTFVTITLDDDIKKNEKDEEVWLKRGTEIIGIQVVPPSSINDNTSDSISSTNNDNGCGDKVSTTRENIISINDIQLYKDSIAILPTTQNKKKKVLYADYISTAATALLIGSTTQQHIDNNNNKDNDKSVGESNNNNKDDNNKHVNKKRVVVIVGGGNYALYLATAYNTLGYKVHVVSARPLWSLPSPSDLAQKKMDGRVVENGVVEIIPPSVGKLSLGFTSAIGEFV